MIRSYRFLSNEEKETIRLLWNTPGSTLLSIGKAIGRDRCVVRDFGAREGLRRRGLPRVSYRYLTPTEKAHIRALWPDKRLSIRDIAARVGRPLSSVLTFARREHLPDRSSVPRRRWTPNEDSFLLYSHLPGKTLAAFLKRSHAAVRQRLMFLREKQP